MNMRATTILAVRHKGKVSSVKTKEFLEKIYYLYMENH